LTGEADRLPMRTTVPILDTATAMTATSAILAAVIARMRLETGQFIEIALLDVAMSALTLYGMSALITGQDFARSGNRAPQTAPSDAFETRTGPLFLTCGNNTLFRRMCVDGFCRPDLADLPEFRSNADRVVNQKLLTETLQAIFMSDTREHWIATLNGIGVPCAAIATIAEAVVAPDVVRRNLVSEIPHPTAGLVPNIRSPYRMSETPAADPVAAPLLGQHTEEVIRSVAGYGADDYARLRRSGAFGSLVSPDG
ncbi:MAG: CoA transferase, partial [Novosphingobium sp.]